MAKIFISYRREDTAYPTQGIYKGLIDRFGKESVIFDVEAIPLGRDFRDYISQEVGKCNILLAVIGNKWLNILKQRLSDPKDYVRIEIQAALESDIPVVPVLVENASIPNETDLPQELSELAYKQASEVRAGADYQSHLNRLISGLENIIPGRSAAKDSTQVEVERLESVPKTFTNSIGMTFVLIPAGRFKMGSGISPTEADRRYGSYYWGYESELPQHAVKISNPYYIQSTQVTQWQYKKVMNKDPGVSFKGDDLPVDTSTWFKAQKFITKLDEMEHTSGYRLPSESEWEYACRAGTITAFSFGDGIEQLGDYAWFADNSEKKTHPVGAKKPNSWGLYDMHGNVWEWVEDDWHDNYNGAPADRQAWIRKGWIGMRSVFRVLRGGSWREDAQFCRSTSRSFTWPVNEGGFRLAKSINLDS